MRSLYLSYDGMTDPLGQSQVVPYLQGLASKGHKIHVISFEKPHRFVQKGTSLRQQLEKAGISWTPLRYHKKPPVLSTLWDLLQLNRAVKSVLARGDFQIIHCRSYITSLIGLRFKRRKKTAFVFDMRGFFADERVEGGFWNLKNPIFHLIYRFFKKREKEFLEICDSAVSLTHRAKDEISKWKIRVPPIQVIPCCVDEEFFSFEKIGDADRQRTRAELGAKKTDFIVTYLGSLGTWYLVDEMLQFFAYLQTSIKDAKLLLVTPDEPEIIYALAKRNHLSKDTLLIRSASREEVPKYLSISDIGLFFIRACYSKMSSSPTKMGEFLSMGIPLIANAGVGDSDWLFSKYRIGHLVTGFTDAEFARAVQAIPSLQKIPREEMRAAATEYFSLTRGVESYHELYQRLCPA